MSADPQIKVLIVDDQTIVRQGLRILLENFTDFIVLDAADSGEIALTLCTYYKPDVVLMDLMMPGMSGIETIAAILKIEPQIKIVVLTSALDEELLRDALEAGAIGYLLKTGSIDEVAEAVRRAYHGLATIATSAVNTLISIQQRPNRKFGSNLTLREREVLALMIQGLNNRQISERMVISRSTVKNHIANIYSKLDVNKRSNAVALALQHKVLE